MADEPLWRAVEVALADLDLVRTSAETPEDIADDTVAAQPHLVLLDAGGRNDLILSLVRELRTWADHESLAILALLDHVDDEALVKLFEAGADDVAGRVVKPIGLRARVLAHLRRIHAIRFHAEKERELLAKALHAEKLTAMAQLAGAAAHELNQPLTAIMTGLELTRRLVPVNEHLNGLMNSVEEEAKRMAEMIRKLSHLTQYATKQYVGAARIIDLERAHGDEQDDD